MSLILLRQTKSAYIKKTKEEISHTSNYITSYLSLLFVPIGVGVVMHLTYLEQNYIPVLAVIFISTILTIGFTAVLMEKINNYQKNNVRKK